MIEVIEGDCYEAMKGMSDDSVDVVISSPPYGNQRRYGSKKALFADDTHWLFFATLRFLECLRVSRGSVLWVVEGYTKGGTFHPLPEMLTVELMKRGANIRRRMIYKRAGIPGGSPDDFAQHHEIIIRASKNASRLPFADPKATGHPPKFPPGGKPSHQSRDGRIEGNYKPPEICKASDVIDCGSVGGGSMGSKLSKENEAPYPERLIVPLVLSYCPPGGTVLDPFCGSGTTGAVAVKNGRNFIGIDNRQSQVELAKRRIKEAQDMAFWGEE